MPREEVQECIAEGRHPTDPGTFIEALPFVPLRRMWYEAPNGAHKPKDCVWLFRCPKLGEDGRCTVYEHRPEVCRVYEPGEDVMCVHYTGPWRGKMSRTRTKEGGDDGTD